MRSRRAPQLDHVDMPSQRNVPSLGAPDNQIRNRNRGIDPLTQFERESLSSALP
jgi:hypothetical protein